MRKQLVILLAVLGLALSLLAVTNVVVTVTLPETKYTNLVTVASNRNVTVEAFLSDVLMAEIEGQRLSLLIELWQRATPAQQQKALDALKE